jgi:hypothetical protein
MLENKEKRVELAEVILDFIVKPRVISSEMKKINFFLYLLDSCETTMGYKAEPDMAIVQLEGLLKETGWIEDNELRKRIGKVLKKLYKQKNGF